MTRVDPLVLVPSDAERRRLSLPGTAPCLGGVGPIEAALTASGLLAERRPSAVWLVGLAGSRDPERAPLGAVVVGREVHNEAVGAGVGENFVPLSAMGLERDAPDPVILALPDRDTLAAASVALAAATGGGGVLTVGALGTVASASASLDEAAAWSRRHPDVLVEEMEGWAVALVCQRAGVPLTVVRVVSNRAGDRDVKSWDWDGAAAALGAVLPVLLGAEA